MERILNYKTFINESSGASTLTPEQINFLNSYVKGKWKLNDGAVDVDGAFICSDKEISDFKGIMFGKVSEDFYCSKNNLTSLEGCPKEVGEGFYCSYNNLTSLEGCPKEVGEHFYCHHNNLTSLEFGPKKVGGDFDCSNNRLTSLEFGPKEVGSIFDCSNNNLTSLEGCPKEVGMSFYCHYNNLTSLEGCPKEVGGAFDCSDNNLTSLEFGPKRVGGALRFSDNEGLSTKTIGLIFDKTGKSKLGYSGVLKSLWKEIPIEDKVLLYKVDLDWIEEDEAAKLSKLKKYSNIKKMI